MSESVPPLAYEILYNNTSGQTAGNSGLTMDTQYVGSRLNSQNLLVQNITNLTGNVGIRTATARQALEVTGNTILTAQGSASQGVREFGLNGSYDTLSLVSPVGLGLNGTTSIFFGLNSVIYYPVARIVAVDNGNYSGSLAFQIGNGSSLYQQMRLTMNGVITANAAFLHKTMNLPAPGTNLCLNFPSVNDGSTSVIDIYFTLQKRDSSGNLDTSSINMAKCTVFLGNQLFVTGITVQNNGTSPLIIKRDGIKASGSKVTLNYADTSSPYVATVNYMVYGPAANFIPSIDITLNDSGVATAPGIPMEFAATPLNVSASLNWAIPSDGGSVITGYTIYTSTGTSVNSSGTLVSDPLRTLLIPVASVPNTDITVTGLTNGTTYTFTIKAMNSIGYSGTASVTVTPAVVPTAPLSASAVAGNGLVTVTWTAPASTGGSTITSYVIAWPSIPPTSAASALASANTSTTSVSSPMTITGLTNGTSYTFYVYARNAIGSSVTYAMTNTVTPITVPNAPTITSVSTGNQSATVNWTAPAFNGGTGMTSFTITYTNISVTPNTITTTAATIGSIAQSSTQTKTISGLSIGTTYTFRVTVSNSVGASLASDSSNEVTTFSVPGTPSIESVVGGYQSATVNWTAPASNGGSPIISYKIIYTNTSTNVSTTTASTIETIPVTTTKSTVVSGLLDATNYTFNVIVNSIVGDSSPSNTSSSITTFSAPGAPTLLTGTAGVNSINLSWTAPTSTGGSAITGYRVYDSSGNLKYDGSGNLATTGLASGLSKATAYTFTVKALNIVGASSASTASAAVTTYDVPGVPTGVTATAGVKSATISWVVPASDGGSPITGYRIYDSSGVTILYDGSGNLATTAPFTGLADGTAYNYLLKALNLVGSSEGALISVTTFNTAGPPIGLSTLGGNATANLSWTAPTSTGGSPILGYKVYDSSGNIYNSTTNTFVSDSSGSILTTTDPITTVILTGLVNGQTYVFTIKTNNAVGDSVSATFLSVIIGIPSAPTNLFAISADQSAILSWSAPTTTGGSPITGYRVNDASGNVAYDGSGNVTRSRTITGLVNGQTYSYTVLAFNANGASELSSAFQVTIGFPGTPLNLTATAGNTAVTLTWSAPSPGGSPISRYGIYDSSGNLITISSPIQFTGLTNGLQYTYRIYAVNSYGNSSVPASISVTPGLPSAPTDLTAIVSDRSVVLNWLAPSGSSLPPTGYIIYDTSGNVQYDGATNITTYATITGLTNGSQYTFLVYSVNATGNSSGSASITIRPFTVPGAPVNLNATTTSTTATLNWLAPSSNGSPIAGYKVYDSSGNIYDSSGNVLTDTGSIYTTTGTTSYIITGLTSKLYTFTVKAANSAGNSSASSISLTPGTPGTPTSLTVVPGDASVVLTWSAPLAGPPVQTSYKIIYAGITILNSVSPKTITGLTNGSQYTFAVYSVNASGDSAPALISATPGLPFAPTNLTGAAGSGSVTLNWSAPSSGPTVTGYQVTVYSTTVLVTLTTLTVSGLTRGTSYTFTVNSQNAVGTSVGSATISVTAV